MIAALRYYDTLAKIGGVWLSAERLLYVDWLFGDAGVQLTLASPKAGQPPLDPKSDLPEDQTPAQIRFKQDLAAQKVLSQTVKLAEVKSEDCDTVFYIGISASKGDE